MTILRKGHAFEGKALMVIGSIKRRGALLLLVILPNGSRSHIPAAWTDWNDAHGNALRAHALIEASAGNFVDADKKLVALLGVNDLIVVDTPDALLIADRSRAQEVGELVKRIEQAGHEHLL